MIKRLAHIGLTVFDLDRMLDFYTNVLGLSIGRQVPHPRGGTIVFLKAPGDEMFEMIRYADAKAHEGRDRSRTGLHHFGLLVDDIQAEVERLKERAWSSTGPSRSTPAVISLFISGTRKATGYT